MSCLFRVSHLSKRYKGEDKFVLDDLSFSLPDRGMIAIAGKSGCGKSTLLHLLLGSLSPTKGKIAYKGKNLAEFSKKDWLKYRRNESSIVFQHYNLMESMTAIDNVALPMRIAGYSKAKANKRAKDLLFRFHLEEHGNKKVCLLSGGEKQRVAICRSLALSPEVIFADEPTGALDSNNATIVMDMLLLISRKALVVIVSHNMELVEKYSDRLLLLKNGKIEQERTFHDIFVQPKKEKPAPKIRQGSWVQKFLGHNLSRHPSSVVARFASGLIGFVSILLSLGFALGNAPALDKEKKNTLDYCSFRLVQKEYVEVPSSPLRLVKESRPSVEDAEKYLAEIDAASIHLDYSFFLPTSLPFDLSGVRQDPSRVLPVYDLSLKEFGEELVLDQLNVPIDITRHCVVNENFVRDYSAEVGQTIHLEYQAQIVHSGSKAAISSSFDFIIHSVVKEFSFLNSPKIYYSYPAVDEYYGNYVLEDFPLKNGRKPTVSSFVRDLNGDENYSNYGFWVFSHGLLGADELVQLLEKQGEDGVLLTSNAYDVANSFSSLAQALLASLGLFIAISVLSLILIIALNAYSSFLRQKKQSAILLALGAKQSDIVSLVSLEGILISGISILSALPIAYFSQGILNDVLGREFGIPNLIQIPYASLFGIPFLLIPLLLLAGVIISFLSSAIPLLFAGRIDLAEALKEE